MPVAGAPTNGLPPRSVVNDDVGIEVAPRPPSAAELKQLVTEALQEKLAVNTDNARPGEPGWMQGFGKLRRLRKETRRIQARIDERFEVLEPEDRA